MAADGFPSDEAFAEYQRQIAEVRAARARGEDTRAATDALTRFMARHGFGDEPTADIDAVDAAPPAHGEVVAAAVLQALADGDTATAERLKALAGRPDELAATIRQLRTT